MRIFSIIMAAWCFGAPGAARAEFIVRAETERTETVRLPHALVERYMKDVNNYSRLYPHVAGITQTGANESRWIYEIPRTMQSPFRAVFDLRERSESPHCVVFESTDSLRSDYLYCTACTTAEGDTATLLDITMKIILPREHGTDFGLLAPLLGAGFVSDRSQEVLSADLAEFLDRASKDLYSRYGAQVSR